MRRRACLALLTASLFAGAVSPVGPAAAHEQDPQVVTVLDDVTPTVPGLELSVVTGVAPQLLLTNATGSIVEVLDDQGRPFLRIGPDDVEVDLARPAAYQVESPLGAATLPADVAAEPDAAPRFYRIARGASYGWFDHRLHPVDRPELPPEVREGAVSARLGDWTVALRARGRDIVARGHVEFRPLLGAFATAGDPPPAGLTSVVLQGRLPALAVSAAPGREVVVRGAAGEPFARLSGRGAEVNTQSPTWVEDQRARGAGDVNRYADPAAPPRWMLVDAAPTLTWLDDRLRWPQESPPSAALASSTPTELGRWRVPVTVEGRDGALTGTISWRPDPARTGGAGGTARTGGTGGTGAAGSRRGLVAVLVLVVVLGALGVSAGLRRRRAAAPAAPAGPLRGRSTGTASRRE